MKINYIILNSYGKFKDKRIEFKDGINIISGNNEAGKSTVMAFIKAMLFGLNGRGNTVANERKRYMPWDGSGISGEICITDDNKNNYVIRRKSGKTQSHDELRVLKPETGEETKYAFESDLGIGESAFVKTLYIKQLSASIDGSDNELTDKLINLVETGDETVGYDEAVNKLTAQIKELKALRGDSGKIDQLKKKILLLNDELYLAKKQNDKLLDSYKRKRALESEIKEKRGRLDFIQKSIENAKKANEQREINNLKTERLKLKEQYEALSAQLSEKIAEIEKNKIFEQDIKDEAYEAVEAPFEYERRLEGLKAWRIFVSAGAVVLALIAFILRAYPFAVIPAALGVFFLILIKKKKSLLTNQVNIIKMTQDTKISELSKFGCASIKEYSEKKSEYKLLKEKAATQKEQLEALEGKLLSLDILLKDAKTEDTEEPFIDITDLIKEEENLNLELSALIKEDSELSGFLTANTENKRTQDVVLTEKNLLEEDLKSAEERFELLQTVRNALVIAYDRVSRNFTPKINEAASLYMKKITGNKDEFLVMDKEYNLTVDRNGMRSIESFSCGTFDQAYLSARLAIIDNLFNNRIVPVFLDDIFSQYDNERLENTLDLLNSMSDRRQIFIFSCKPVNCNFNCNYINI